MKLKTFTPDNCQALRGGNKKPSISMNSKSGLIAINQPACELLELKEGDMLLLHQEEDKEDCWYIEKVKKEGSPLRKKDAVGSGLFFNSTTLVKSVFTSVAYEGRSGRLLVAGQPTKVEKRNLYGLLLTGLKNS